MEGNKRKNPNLPVIRIVFIVISFLLALLDMTLLSKSWEIVTGHDPSTSTFVAFALATAANFIALTWGWGNGRRSEKKLINKRSFGEAAAWIVIGIVYLVVRVIEIFVKIDGGGEDFNMIGKLAEMSVLAVSYIGTGFLIVTSARELFDADCVAYRRAKKEFEEAHNEIATNDAILRQAIGVLEQYDLNYEALDSQKEKISSAIYKAEQGTMESIAGIEVAKHNINPVYVNEIIEEVIGKKKSS